MIVTISVDRGPGDALYEYVCAYCKMLRCRNKAQFPTMLIFHESPPDISLNSCMHPVLANFTSGKKIEANYLLLSLSKCKQIVEWDAARGEKSWIRCLEVDMR